MVTLNQLVKRKNSRLVKCKRGSRSRLVRNCSFRRGMCLKVSTMKPKKPNSAQRKIAKVKLRFNRGKLLKSIICYIPGCGHNLREYSDVIVRGGHVPDLPGVQYRLVRGSLDFNWKEDYFRRKSRSKYGISLEESLKHFDKKKRRKKK